MKSISVSKARSSLEALLDSAQKERIMITRARRPSAIIVGIEAYDEEDLQLASSAEFWRMIEERRHGGSSISLAKVKARLELKGKAGLAARKRKRSQDKKKTSANSRSRPGRR